MLRENLFIKWTINYNDVNFYEVWSDCKTI